MLVFQSVVRITIIKNIEKAKTPARHAVLLVAGERVLRCVVRYLGAAESLAGWAVTRRYVGSSGCVGVRPVGSLRLTFG